MISVVQDLEDGSARVGKIIILQPSWIILVQAKINEHKFGVHFNEGMFIDWLEGQC